MSRKKTNTHLILVEGEDEPRNLFFEELWARPGASDQLMTEYAARMGDSCIYFLQMGHDGPIKIGRSTYGGLDSRLRTLQTGNPERLHLRDVQPGDAKAERELHDAFAEFRMEGEWFHSSPKVAAVNLGNAAPLDGPRHVHLRPIAVRPVLACDAPPSPFATPTVA